MIKKWTKKQNELADLHVEAARRGGIWAIYKLFNRYYIKSFFGPFFTFVFPVLIFAILGTLMDAKYMFAGIAAMSAMSSGITGMPFAIMELKKSVILKRIGASPVKPSKFTVVIITYFTAMIFISIAWLMLWAMILHPSEIDTFFSGLGQHNGVSAIGFIYGNLLNIIMSLSIGFAISAIAKGEQQAQAIGMLIYFPSTFLAGQFISIDNIAQNDVMNWISRFTPFRYTTMLVISSWNGDNIFAIGDITGVTMATPEDMRTAADQWLAINAGATALPTLDSINPQTMSPEQIDMVMKINGVKYITLYQKTDVILGYVVPYVFGILCTIFSIKKFRWSAAR